WLLVPVVGSYLGGTALAAWLMYKDRKRSRSLDDSWHIAEFFGWLRPRNRKRPRRFENPWYTVSHSSPPAPAALSGAATVDHVPDAAPTPPFLLAPPDDLPQVPGYEVLAVLGQGGMGTVYQARQLLAKRLVALKMMRQGMFPSPSARERFHREARALARLQHPHIVQVYDLGECQGRPFLELEFVAGNTLARQLQDAPLPAHTAAQLIRTLAQAVHYAHEHGVVHRDLKPANILLENMARTENTEKNNLSTFAPASSTVD